MAVNSAALIRELARTGFLTLADLTQALTFDCPTLGDGYQEPSNGFKVTALGHMKSAQTGSIWRRREQAGRLDRVRRALLQPTLGRGRSLFARWF